jgi:hypothetical protein
LLPNNTNASTLPLKVMIDVVSTKKAAKEAASTRQSYKIEKAIGIY